MALALAQGMQSMLRNVQQAHIIHIHDSSRDIKTFKVSEARVSCNTRSQHKYIDPAKVFKSELDNFFTIVFTGRFCYLVFNLFVAKL